MALERLPYFKFHCADYLLDTLALTMPQHGAYCLLMFNYYWNGALPKSRIELHELCRADSQEKKTDVDFVIGRFFTETPEGFTHNRIERERAKLGDMVRTNSAAGKASAAVRAKKPPRLKRMNGSPNGFDAFYAAYPIHVKRSDAEKAWNKISPDDDLRSNIMAAVEQQRKSEQWTRDGGKFIPHPASWLNGRRWEDEVKPIDGMTQKARDRYDPTKAQM